MEADFAYLTAKANIIPKLIVTLRQVAKLLRLGRKNKQICFVLLSTFRNFARSKILKKKFQFLVVFCHLRAISYQNVFIKPNDQSQACLSFGMARKRRMKSNESNKTANR